MGPQIVHFRLESWIFLGLAVFGLKFEDQWHQCLGDIAPTKVSKAAIRIWPLIPCVPQIHRPAFLALPARI